VTTCVLLGSRREGGTGKERKGREERRGKKREREVT
jgi:hypothetical protein